MEGTSKPWAGAETQVGRGLRWASSVRALGSQGIPSHVAGSPPPLVSPFFLSYFNKGVHLNDSEGTAELKERSGH